VWSLADAARVFVSSAARILQRDAAAGRGLHSSTSQLNLSRF
jgi:hypothetical protein